MVFNFEVVVVESLQWKISEAMPKSYKFSQICPFPILQQQSRGEREKKVEHGKKRGGVGGGVAIGSSPSDGQIRQGSRKKGEEEGIREGD